MNFRDVDWQKVGLGIAAVIAASGLGVGVHNYNATNKEVDLSQYATKEYVNQVMKNHLQEYH